MKAGAVNPLDGIVRAGSASPCWKDDVAGRVMAFLADAQVAADVCRIGLDGGIWQKRAGVRLCVTGSI